MWKAQGSRGNCMHFDGPSFRPGRVSVYDSAGAFSQVSLSSRHWFGFLFVKFREGRGAWVARST